MNPPSFEQNPSEAELPGATCSQAKPPETDAQQSLFVVPLTAEAQPDASDESPGRTVMRSTDSFRPHPSLPNCGRNSSNLPSR